jgi:septal ring factor EnvC (AmiA/AmiB activator)
MSDAERQALTDQLKQMEADLAALRAAVLQLAKDARDARQEAQEAARKVEEMRKADHESG